MTALHFQTAVLSMAGRRADNQDAYCWRDGLWLVADGLGGHGGGAVAARVAVETFLQVLPPECPLESQVLASGITATAAVLQAYQQSHQALAGMRTTLALLMSDGRQALWLHLGDSRVYGFRAGRIMFQTADHSVAQALVRAGDVAPEAVRFHEDRHRLLRTLGDQYPPRPTLAEAPLALLPDDAFLLCTDGFWEAVTEAEMLSTLAEASSTQDWLDRMEGILRTRQLPDQDNYTALTVWVSAIDPSTGPTLSSDR
ncbi:serine/threonine-protein phosphatase [Caldichromatium japonicum]|uniref:Serine/threonine-protein phosphatase n=1 Tax=Caldichromatium japonicum TaxID=2699430 RepID=A0A6G7VD83_9GAMM|nr:PP2C family serine/threonine-protein phosphatase [Caldichromatium japonicum]QIK37845.1 serine/threonine-protein phosphatase [Caldichromatium japonicum]